MAGVVSEPQFVFAYGSLVGPGGGVGLGGGRGPGARAVVEAQPAHLSGVRRVWNVAMDNSVTIPGYKYYVDPASGERPEVFVTFLNLGEDRECAVNGVLLAVDAGTLAALDARERNYDRAEITERVAEPVSGRVWTYVGSDAGRARSHRGRACGGAVIVEGYRAAVAAGFEQAGDTALAEFERSTTPAPYPIVDLVQVDGP